MYRRLLSLLLMLTISFSFSHLAFAISKSSSDVHVRGYFRKDGTYVHPYYRTAPDNTKANNFSHCGNLNPYTGKIGTMDCGIGSSRNGSIELSSSTSYQNEQSLPSGTVNVKLPNFYVSINGERRQLPNELRKYPLFVYKDITYIPMTWNYTHALGLDVSWSQDEGFSIRKGNNKVDTLGNEDVAVNDSVSYVATIPNYNIYINDSWVDNSKEEYPILSFRDITYFPMTWHFATDLGLQTSWSETEGFGLQKQ